MVPICPGDDVKEVADPVIVEVVVNLAVFVAEAEVVQLDEAEPVGVAVVDDEAVLDDEAELVPDSVAILVEDAVLLIELLDIGELVAVATDDEDVVLDDEPELVADLVAEVVAVPVDEVVLVGVGILQFIGPPDTIHELSVEFKLIVMDGPTYPTEQVHVYDVTFQLAMGLIALGKTGSFGR